jgi:hypothetical protein
MDAEELLWRLYEDNREFARHHEHLRATASNLTMAISAGVLGLVTFDGHLGTEDFPLTLLLAILGFFGALFTAKHYERVRLHLNRAAQYFAKLDESYPNSKIDELRRMGTSQNNAAFPRLNKLRLHRFWIALHLLVSLLGVSLTIIILYRRLRGT